MKNFFRHIFNHSTGDTCMQISDNTAMDPDGHIMVRTSDNTVMDMQTGQIDIVSGWESNNNDGSDSFF